MTRATVLIPTHDHADMIARAIASVRRQTVPDFELFVVGDGAPLRTREIMAALCAEDGRITYFDNEKGEGHGERHRHAALEQANGQIVCYLGDDDLWLPHHLATMLQALETADFANSIYVNVRTDGLIGPRCANLADERVRHRLLEEPWNVVSPSCAGHRLDAYRRLPHGWRPRPKDVWSDLYMWRQWVAEPWCRFRSIADATSLSFPSPRRTGLTAQQRLAELDGWLARTAEPDFHSWLVQVVLQAWMPRTEMPAWLAARRAGVTFSRQLQAAGRNDDALRAARSALELRPDEGDAHLNLGGLLVATGDLAAAEAATRKALAAGAEPAAAYRQLSSILFRQDRLDEAIAAARQAIAADGDDAEFHHHLGCLVAGTGALDEAETLLRRGLALRPAAAIAADTWRRLGEIMYRRGQRDEALAAARQAIALNDEQVEAHHLLGGLLLLSGARAEAEVALRRAVELQPGYAPAHRWLSALFVMTRRFDLAIAEARTAVALSPDDEEFRRHLGTLLAEAERTAVVAAEPPAGAGGG